MTPRLSPESSPTTEFVCVGALSSSAPPRPESVDVCETTRRSGKDEARRAARDRRPNGSKLPLAPLKRLLSASDEVGRWGREGKEFSAIKHGVASRLSPPARN